LPVNLWNFADNVMMAQKRISMANPTERPFERVRLRMTPTAKRMLQSAAAATNKTLTEFVLGAGLNAALDTLADRRVFQLDDKDWEAFKAALAAPPNTNPKLGKLLARKAAWEL
jgi:uncharacterized protein (DUF1778 family)